MLEKITSGTKKSGPFVRLQYRRFIQSATQQSGQLNFNINLLPDKDQCNSEAIGLGAFVETQGF